MKFSATTLQSRTGRFLANTREILTAPYRFYMAVMMSLYAGALTTAPTLCAKIKTNINMDTLFGNMADIVIKIAFYVGALIAIGGVFTLILAYKDDNAEGQSRAVRLIVVGVMLVGFQTVLKIAGIIS